MVAQAKGYLAETDLGASLSIELGWASVESKLASGQLCAANVPPSFPLSLSLKKSGVAPTMRALAITAQHGEAITLNREAAAAFQAGKLSTLKSLRIGVDAPHTLSPVLVRSWLKEARAEHHPGIQLVPLAISQLVDLLNDGYIQGFCCAEPIGQIAVENDLGVTVARSRDHPLLQIESVLAATDEFCNSHPAEAAAIAFAVNRARVFCANPKHEAEILRIYRKHLMSKQAVPSRFFLGSGQTPALSTLVGFEPASSVGSTSAKAKDPLGPLAALYATLPGITAGEREIREAIKRTFPGVP